MMDPYLSSNFHVEIEGIFRATFREVGGLESRIEQIKYREGGDQKVSQHAGMVEYANITLAYGMTDDTELYDWHMQWVNGEPDAARRDGAIVLLDRGGQERARWNFRQAWPVKWTGPTFKAAESELAIDRFELAHHGITRG